MGSSGKESPQEDSKDYGSAYFELNILVCGNYNEGILL